jgi:type IV pilus assembly protein PilM
MGLFGNGSIVGIELDTAFIRGVEVKGKNGGVRVIGAGQVPIPENAVVDGVVQNVEAVSDALGKLWSRARFKSRDVVLGMFNQHVIMRLVNFPKVPHEKLEQALRLQAGEYFPIPLSQMILDFAVVGETTGEDGPQYEILLVAARKAQLEVSLKALGKSKLVPRVVDAPPLALTRVLPKEKLEGTVVLVDLSMGLSSIALCLEGMPRFARVMPSSLKQYITSLGPVQAPSGDYHDYVAATLEQGNGEAAFARWGLNVAQEIRSSVSFYLKQGSFSEVDRIVLCGKGARVTGLAELIQEELGVPVEVVQTLANVKMAGKSEFDVNGPEFAVSLGLALRGLEV